MRVTVRAPHHVLSTFYFGGKRLRHDQVCGEVRSVVRLCRHCCPWSGLRGGHFVEFVDPRQPRDSGKKLLPGDPPPLGAFNAAAPRDWNEYHY